MIAIKNGLGKIFMKRFEVYFCDLNPTIGSEIKKVRPCLIISPDEINNKLKTVIVVPITSKIRIGIPTLVDCQIQGRKAQIICNQIRNVSKERLKNKICTVEKEIGLVVCDVLQRMFSY